MTKLTADIVRTRLSYCRLTGEFRWRVRGHSIRPGKLAGTRTQHGYIQIKICNEIHLAHRLAWLHVTGEWPNSKIDHRDRDGTNNRFTNLREANTQQNKANSCCSAASTIGFKGVERSLDRYMARIKKDGVRYYLGTFDTPEEANAAYFRAAQELFGEFARAS